MGTDPGPLIASGRAADVYDHGDDMVLRRYKGDFNCELEARAMRWVRANGVPVPLVHDAEGRDLVMERISGPTLLEDLEKRPWKVVAHAKLLASLQEQLNALEAPEWFPEHPGVPSGDRALHLDLHPMNVMLGDKGPVIIDWSNFGRGRASFDAALTMVVMSTFVTRGVRDRVARRLMVSAFIRSRGRSFVRESLYDACRFRLQDRNITDTERVRVERMLGQ